MNIREVKLYAVLGSLVLATWAIYIAVAYLFVPYLSSIPVALLMIVVLGSIFSIAKALGNKILKSFHPVN
jgi:hypothetical protein